MQRTMHVRFEGLELGVWFYGDGFDLSYEISVDCWDSLAETFGALGDYPMVVTSLQQLVRFIEEDSDWNNTLWLAILDQYETDIEAAEDSYWQDKIDLARGK